MQPWRRTAVVLALLCMLAWSIYCLFFLLTLGTPAIEGAAEVAERWRVVIIVGWLAGLAVGSIAVFSLSRGTFDRVARRVRVWIASAAVVLSAAVVVSLYWLELSGVLLFLWGPLAGAVLLLVAWASSPRDRHRLGQAATGWGIGFAAVAALWFVLPSGTLQFHFWTLLFGVTAAAVVWWAWPGLADAARRLATG